MPIVTTSTVTISATTGCASRLTQGIEVTTTTMSASNSWQVASRQDNCSTSVCTVPGSNLSTPSMIEITLTTAVTAAQIRRCKNSLCKRPLVKPASAPASRKVSDQ